MSIEPKSDQEWQAYSDAKTLAEATVIQNDATRLSDAKQMAKRIAEEEAEKAQAMRKVAGSRTGVSKKPADLNSGPNPFNVFKRI